jgi:dihydropteroate synthase
VAEAGLPAFLMATDYTPGDAVGLAETKTALATVIKRCEAAGIDNYILDPGIGIWTPQRSCDDNWELCRHFDEFLAFDRPLLGAISRKSFIGNLINREPEERLAASLAVTTVLLQKGASVIRTHDVKETVDTVKVFLQMVKGP